MLPGVYVCAWPPLVEVRLTSMRVGSTSGARVGCLEAVDVIDQP